MTAASLCSNSAAMDFMMQIMNLFLKSSNDNKLVRWNSRAIMKSSCMFRLISFLVLKTSVNWQL
jgi:hypothetical protein